MKKIKYTTDAKGIKLIGHSPDRTCLISFMGFSFDKMNKDGSCPCCSLYNHAAVYWK